MTYVSVGERCSLVYRCSGSGGVQAAGEGGWGRSAWKGKGVGR